MLTKSTVIGLLRAMFGLSATGGSNGGITVSQPGGIAGTDDLKIYHNGTNGVLEAMSGGVLLDNQDSNGYGVFGANGISASYVGQIQALGSNGNILRLTNSDQAYNVLLALSPPRLRIRGEVLFTGLALVGFENFPQGMLLSATDGTTGSATSVHTLPLKKTGIADNTATSFLTVTIPNGNHAAVLKLTLLSSNGSTDAFESSRVATGTVVFARTTDANAVATAVAIANEAIATVGAVATHTLAYDVGTVGGAAGAANTFAIRVTIDDSGNLGSNQLVALCELINAEASGVTMAAA